MSREGKAKQAVVIFLEVVVLVVPLEGFFLDSPCRHKELFFPSGDL